MSRQIILIGDRVLIDPDRGEGATDAGLYLPQTVKEKEKVQTGTVVQTGPGYPVPDPVTLDQEPWLKGGKDKYFPLQARSGDYCIFLREHAVEIRYDRQKYLVVPHAAILALIRQDSL
ncbi:MAG: co-chaperone GroES [Candidatus Omnitrophica bacterium]|nr:co-chaperone GroES [Candidatus Omnitrophota bacterium]